MPMCLSVCLSFGLSASLTLYMAYSGTINISCHEGNTEEENNGYIQKKYLERYVFDDVNYLHPPRIFASCFNAFKNVLICFEDSGKNQALYVFSLPRNFAL